MTTARDAWDSLQKPWRECLNMAWEAHSIGTIPVGAVLVDPSENIVATGRNGVYGHESQSPEKTRLLAHAEVNALLHLDLDVHYERHTVYGSLEPCMLCIGAATLANVGTIRYAGVDPYAGASPLVGHNRLIDNLRFTVEGPLPGPFGLLAAALHVEFYLRRNPNGSVVRAYRDSEPVIVAVAEALLAHGVAEESSQGRSLLDCLPQFWDTLATSSS